MSIIGEFVKKEFPLIKRGKKIVAYLKQQFAGLFRQIEKYYYIIIVKKKQQKKLKELKHKEKIICVILVHFVSMFREYLYQKLIECGRFDVYVVISPVCSHGEDNKRRQLTEAFDYLTQKGYSNVIMGYDIERNQYFNIKKELTPDVIIYTNPYKDLIAKEHYVTNFLDSLSIYIPYYINNTVEYRMAYDELLHNVVWRYYVETEWHKKLSQKYATNHSRNVVVTGYSGVDRFLDKTYKPSVASWKICDSTHKRIIWAPHQTIDSSKEMYYSAFLLIADEMTQLAIKYKNKIQIAFKPHPLLVNSLYKAWGKERTDCYYEKWRNMDNTCIVEGVYSDLFLTSDAIIHDSASFITEYLIINRPALRTYNGRDPQTQFNDFSLACLDHYYKAYNIEDIENFILNVINDIDPMKESRTNFVKSNLLPRNGKLPSENILADVLDSIENQKLYR